MLETLVETLNANRKKIVFTEGNDLRILEAASRLLADNLMDVILLGNIKEVEGLAKENGLDISKAAIMDPATSELYDEMVEKLSEIRRGKRDEAKAPQYCRQANYFGTMLVKMNLADCLLGGATYSTADTVRPALQIIKTVPGDKIVSSTFVLCKECDNVEQIYFMSDCAINIDPSSEELVEITKQTARTARRFGAEPIVSLLSYSTHGSGKGESVDKVREAAETLKSLDLDFAVDGELQFDASVSEVVAAKKAPESKVAGHANTFIFPNINAGNIGYKIAQRLGGYSAFGPILQGLNAPINDLSRGCDADEVYNMAIITAGLA